ncbi:MAG: hypothetical protein KC912_08320 [Proteobacteria bacterium]|nr:hypothetical protein [Pseudomonadota bacterium]
MADKRTQRAQKKREKARKKRAGKQHVGRAAASGGLKSAAGWPTGDCWATDTYDQRGTDVLVCFTRQNESGRVAAAFFEIDLTEEGVRKVQTFGNVTDQQVMGEIGQRSDEDTTVVQVDPSLAVKIVLAARDLMDDAPKGYGDAVGLFGEIDPEDALEDIPTGYEPTEEVVVPTGLFSGVKRFFGLI